MSKEIPLSNSSLVILVDDADYDHLSQWTWRLDKHGYAYRSTSTYVRGTGKRRNKNISMARLIMGFPKSFHVEHRDQNPLNNTRSNLRIATVSQNNANRKRQSNNPGIFKGVHRHPRSPKWQATIRHNKKSIYLGMFHCPKEAAKAYNEKTIELFGEFACLNKVE